MGNVIGIIPARYASTRFPGKPLHLIAGKPLIQHVWEQARKTQHLDSIVVATDSEVIAEAVNTFGGIACMTAEGHSSGTDRLAEAVQQFPEATHVINIQGDEPMICPRLIDELALTLLEDPAIEMITAANVFKDGMDPNDANIVKVVLNKMGNALYFSRSVIPHFREPAGRPSFYRHKGIYGFTRELLLRFVHWEPSPLELAESLEQLRALENGVQIRVVITEDDSIGVDTREQADLVQQQLQPV